MLIIYKLTKMYLKLPQQPYVIQYLFAHRYVVIIYAQTSRFAMLKRPMLGNL